MIAMAFHETFEDAWGAASGMIERLYICVVINWINTLQRL